MSAAYKALAANAGFLRHWTSLNSTTKAEAEEAANAYIDTEFSEWDRTSWTGALVPVEIQMIALRVGSAEYIQRDFLATNPDGASNRDGMQSVIMLRSESADLVDQSKARGFLFGQSGQKIFRTGDSGTSGKSSFNVELVR